MKVTMKTEGQTAFISPEGRIDTVTAPELEDSISKVPEGITAIKFDFANVEYVSSAGLRVLLVAQKMMKKAGGAMTTANLPPAVKEVFDITGFSDILTIV